MRTRHPIQLYLSTILRHVEKGRVEHEQPSPQILYGDVLEGHVAQRAEAGDKELDASKTFASTQEHAGTIAEDSTHFVAEAAKDRGSSPAGAPTLSSSASLTAAHNESLTDQLKQEPWRTGRQICRYRRTSSFTQARAKARVERSARALPTEPAIGSRA